MRRIALILTITALFISCSRNEKSDFEKHFYDKTLRINLIHTGDAGSETFMLDKLYDDGLWYGRTKNLVNPYRLGKYFFEVRDTETNELLYSDGMSTFFSEWRMTDEAQNTKKSFQESIRIPYPQEDAILTMYRIDSIDVTEPVWEYSIDRKTKAFMEPAKNHNNRIVRLFDSGNPKDKIDIVIIGEGYGLDEIKKFDADALFFYNIMMDTEPFKSRKTDFNVHAIQVKSSKKGINTMINRGVFGYENYALAFDEWTFRKYAVQSPYDYAVILLNDENNIGGSLYNLYTITAVRSQSEDFIIRHELGHQIVGTADKFYSNDAADDSKMYYYDDFTDLTNKILDLHTK